MRCRSEGMANSDMAQDTIPLIPQPNRGLQARFFDDSKLVFEGVVAFDQFLLLDNTVIHPAMPGPVVAGRKRGPEELAAREPAANRNAWGLQGAAVFA